MFYILHYFTMSMTIPQENQVTNSASPWMAKVRRKRRKGVQVPTRPGRRSWRREGRGNLEASDDL